ncbi:MAG: MFS transporter [Opitutaceae bacterium]|nr:MFS transporter [Opitutaceae bacterium]
MKDRLAFTAGIITAQNSTNIFNQMLVPIYQITLGVNPLLIGALQTIMRLWDAFTDPLVAAWSDRTRTRWGRRRPFIFIGGILTAFTFPFLWLPSSTWSESTVFTYLVVASVVFLTFHTLFNIAYEALGLELTSDYNERTRLYSFRGYLPPILSLGASWLYAFIQSGFFSSPLQGMRIVGCAIATLMLLTCIWPAVLLREKAPRSAPASVSPPKIGLLRDIRETLSSRPFQVMIVIGVFGFLAQNVFNQLNLYAKIYVLYAGDTKAGAHLAGWLSVVYFVVFMASIPLGTWLAQRYSKKAVLMGSSCIGFLSGFAKLVLYDPKHPYLILLIPFFAAPVTSVASYMLSAMMADVAFHDRWRTGRRREAMFTAVSSWLYKLSFSLSGILSGAVLVAIGFDVSLGGAQTEFTKRWIIYGMVLGNCLPAIITFGALLFYPLTPALMERCRRELEAMEGTEDANASAKNQT